MKLRRQQRRGRPPSARASPSGPWRPASSRSVFDRGEVQVSRSRGRPGRRRPRGRIGVLIDAHRSPAVNIVAVRHQWIGRPGSMTPSQSQRNHPTRETTLRWRTQSGSIIRCRKQIPKADPIPSRNSTARTDRQGRQDPALRRRGQGWPPVQLRRPGRRRRRPAARSAGATARPTKCPRAWRRPSRTACGAWSRSPSDGTRSRTRSRAASAPPAWSWCRPAPVPA